MAPADGDTIAIELAYSPAPRQVELHTLRIAAGSTVMQALQTLQVAQGPGGCWGHPGLDPTQCTVGVWGRRVALSHLLREGDRLELYRALKVDPKEARRLRYRKQGDRGRVRRKLPEPG